MDINTLKYLSGINETPIKDIEYVGQFNKEVNPNKDKEYNKHVNQEFNEELKRVIRKKFKNIDFDIWIYIFVTSDYGIHNARHLKAFKPLTKDFNSNPDYYIEIQKDELTQFLGDSAKKIKHTENGLTLLYFHNIAGLSKITPWLVMHDIVHGITSNNVNSVSTFSKLDKFFGNTDIVSLMTTKSALSGELRKQEHEATTELMTQFMFNGKIEFNKNTPQKILNLVPKINNIFSTLINDSKGKIIVVQN